MNKTPNQEFSYNYIFAIISKVIFENFTQLVNRVATRSNFARLVLSPRSIWNFWNFSGFSFSIRTSPAGVSRPVRIELFLPAQKTQKHYSTAHILTPSGHLNLKFQSKRKTWPSGERGFSGAHGLSNHLFLRFFVIFIPSSK